MKISSKSTKVLRVDSLRKRGIVRNCRRAKCDNFALKTSKQQLEYTLLEIDNCSGRHVADNVAIVVVVERCARNHRPPLGTQIALRSQSLYRPDGTVTRSTQPRGSPPMVGISLTGAVAQSRRTRSSIAQSGQTRTRR